MEINNGRGCSYGIENREKINRLSNAFAEFKGKLSAVVENLTERISDAESKFDKMEEEMGRIRDSLEDRILKLYYITITILIAVLGSVLKPLLGMLFKKLF